MIRVETRNTGTVVPKQTDLNSVFFSVLLFQIQVTFLQMQSSQQLKLLDQSMMQVVCQSHFFFVQIGSLFISSPPSPVYSSQLYLGKVALSAIGWNQKGSCINYD